MCLVGSSPRLKSEWKPYNDVVPLCCDCVQIDVLSSEIVDYLHGSSFDSFMYQVCLPLTHPRVTVIRVQR